MLRECKNHTISIAINPLAQDDDEIKQSSKYSHIRYNTDLSRINMYCHILTNLSGIINIIKQIQKINKENIKLDNLAILLYHVLLALRVGSQIYSFDVIRFQNHDLEG